MTIQLETWTDRHTGELLFAVVADVRQYHDPGDEDRRPDGPWCSRCGDAFEGPERPCPNPAPGEPYIHCGRGGHMFDLADDPSAPTLITSRPHRAAWPAGPWPSDDEERMARNSGWEER